MAVQQAGVIASGLALKAPAGSLPAIFDYPNDEFAAAFASWVVQHDMVD